jgi:hypothetical protein
LIDIAVPFLSWMGNEEKAEVLVTASRPWMTLVLPVFETANKPGA